MGIRIIGVAGALAFVACGGSEPPAGGGGPPQLKANLGIDLATVKGFVIAPVANPNPARGAGVADPTIAQLFTLNADGSLTTVTVVTTIDGDGEASSSSSSMNEGPTAVFDTRNFVLIGFNHVEYQGSSCGMVAARKSDSALFCIPVLAPNGPETYLPTVDSDATGQYIAVLSRESLYVLDFASGSGPAQSTLIDNGTDGSASLFVMSSRGDVLATVRPQMMGSGFARIYRRSGGFSNHGDATGSYTSGIGDDAANFYYVVNIAGGGAGYYLHKLTFNGATYDDSVIFDDSAGIVGLATLRSENASLVKSGGIIYQARIKGGSGAGAWNYFVELVNGGTPVRHTATTITTIEKLHAFNSGLVIVGLDPIGNSMLVRWLPAGDSYTTVLAPGEYSISKTSVAAAGEITFAGRRLADNARIVGTIAAGTSTVTVVPQTFVGDVIQVKRIN